MLCRKNRHGRGHERLSFFRQSVVKMNPPFISLCPEISRADALTLMDWLEDDRVTCHSAIHVMSRGSSGRSSIGCSYRS
jgi:hypothetical protein